MDRFYFVAIMLFAMQRNEVFAKCCKAVDRFTYTIVCEDSGTLLFKLS